MGAIGALAAIVVWCCAWSLGTTRLALGGFNEPDARFGGLPARIWVAVFVVWSWPLLLAAASWASWLLWAVVGVGPAGILVVLLELVLKRRSRRLTT